MFAANRLFCGLVAGCLLLGLTGCQKAKELADSAVNKVKEDFKNAKEKIDDAAKSDDKGDGKKEIPFSKPKADSSSRPGSNSMSVDAFMRLGSSRIEDRHVAALAADPSIAAKVTELKLSGARITGKAFDIMTKFPNLQRLDLTRVNATVGNMQRVGKLKSLKALDVSFNPLTDQDFAGISGLTNLEEINLTATKITDEGFRCFKQMPKLALMMMDRMGHLQGTGFKYVNRNSLREIRANGSSIGLNAFKSIGGSESLEVLYLNAARVTDEAMRGIGSCPNLKELRVEKNDLTNKGVSYLKNHRKLERLILAGNVRLNNQALGFLTKVKSLKMVNVNGTMCSPVVEAEFLKYVPGCKLVF